MSTDTEPAAARAAVRAFATGRAPGAWRLDRGAVAARLGELVDNPDLVRQGRLNLCGPAAALVLWLRHDPVGAVGYAVRLFETGSARFGTLPVAASPALLGRAYPEGFGCPPADWMMMAALRDSTNRLLRYAHPGGLREASAAITLPGALRRWLTAVGLPVVDETRLAVRRGVGHAVGLVPGPGCQPALLVAQEMFRRTASRRGRARDRVVSLVPNHWVLLRSPVVAEGDRVSFRFWSWGARHHAVIERPLFARCYYGSLLVGERPLRWPGSVL